MSIADLKVRISANAEKFDSVMKKMGKSFDKTVRKMERTGKQLTQKLTVPIGIMALAAGKAAIDFESAFAGVRKTVDATESEFAGLRKGIIEMSKVMPTSADEIAGVAEAAGQLGIKTEAILGFAETMVKLGDTTNLTAQEAATALARFANIMQLPQDTFDEMGSTIVDLGNNFATTEAEITEFATRMAGAGSIAGLAASDIFGIAAAMSSVGVKAEAGGTAVQKVLININTAVAESNDMLVKFADVAGMSAQEFQTAWREDAGQAFAAFVNGLGRRGDQAAGTLDELGLADQRLIRAFLSLANAGDLVNESLDTASEAWKENTALTEEAEERYKTVWSRLLKLKNRIEALGISIGTSLMPMMKDAIEAVEGLTIWFENLSEGAKRNILTIAAFAAAAGPLALLTAKALKAAKAMRALTATMIANPYLAVAAAIAAIGGQAFLVHQRINALNDAVAEALSVGIETQTLESVNKLVAELGERVEGVKKFAKAFGASNKELEGLESQLDKLIELRDELATKQITEVINKKEAEKAQRLADELERAAAAADALALKKIQAGPVIARAPSAPVVGADTSSIMGPLLEKFDKVPQKFKTAGEAALAWSDTSGQAIQALTSVANTFTNSFGQGMTNLIVQGEKFVDVLENIGKLLVSSLIQKAIGLFLTGGLSGGGFFGSGGGLFGAIFGRDIGGPAFADKPLLIGKGPQQELFIPDRGGSIMPNSKLRGMASSFEGLTIHITGELRGNGKELIGVIKDTQFRLSR